MPEEGTTEWDESVAYIINDRNTSGSYSAALVV